MESSLRRDRTCVLCLGGQILIHCTTKEVQKKNFFLSIKKVWEIQAIISQFQLGLLSTAAIYAPKGKRSYVLG